MTGPGGTRGAREPEGEGERRDPGAEMVLAGS